MSLWRPGVINNTERNKTIFYEISQAEYDYSIIMTLLYIYGILTTITDHLN